MVARAMRTSYATWPWRGAKTIRRSERLVSQGRTRGRTPRADSDVDLIVLTDEPSRLLNHDEWQNRFGDVELVRSETFGVLVERRLRLVTGLDIEVGVVPTSWAATDPVDAGTHRVVSGGFQVLYDRDGLLTKLVQSVSSTNA